MKKSEIGTISLIFITILLTSTIIFRAYAPSTWQGYVKPSFPDYAPSGMPDFDEKQDGWKPHGFFTWCGPVAAADTLWWLDSEYESLVDPNPVVPPPTVSDHFPLITNFGSPWDDHDQQNVAPLVPALASMMDTDGIHSGDGHIGTRFADLVTGIQSYVAAQNLSGIFEVHNTQFPNSTWIDNETEKCQGVILFLEFYLLSGATWLPFTSDPSLEAGHFVAVAGVNVTNNPNQLLISDPYKDNYELGSDPLGRQPVVPPAHNSSVHNDTQYVSQDGYSITTWLGPPPSPYGPGIPVLELVNYLQISGYPNPNLHTFIRAAVATSPKQIAQWRGYVKPSFIDYAQSGMPDFDEKQPGWNPTGAFTWCVPVAVADSLWWLDSKYESPLNPAPVPPPTISDHFNLVPAFGPWDDHDPQNVDPLVHTLAGLMDTDGQTSHDGHVGTRWTDVQKGIQKYLTMQGMAGLFEVHNSSFPTFNWIDNQTEQCQDVELFLEFYQQIAPGVWSNSSMTIPSLENGHCVTLAGANATLNPGEVLISDPYQDAFEAGTAPRGGREPAPHAYPHAATDHNDTQHVSQDAYQVTDWLGPGPGPYGPLQDVWELVGYLQTIGFDPSWHTFLRMAVATSPSGIHDIAVTNVTSPKKIIFQGYTGNVTTTVANHGDYNETFDVTLYVNMTAFFNMTATSNTTMIAKTAVTLPNGTSTMLNFMWNTTGFTKGNYTIFAAADIVSGETKTDDNNFTDGWIMVTMIGDITGPTPFVPDGKCNIMDIALVAKHFGEDPASPGWNANCDVNNDGKVDIRDIALVAKHFGEVDP